MTADFPKVGLIPILSESRGVAIVMKKWLKKGRCPDAIVIEHPGHAGGHLGAARIEDLHAERCEFAMVIEQCQALFQELSLGADAPPLILSGGIDSHEKVRHWLGNGASAAQLGTAFAVTEEGDAHIDFKRVLMEAELSQRMDCLTQCGLRDGNAKVGQFCIDLKLVAALKGDVQKGLFFRGAGSLPFGQAIRSVKDLIDYLLYGQLFT